MATVLKIEPFGEDLDMVLPPELLAQMKLAEGDYLLLEQTPEGWVMKPVSAETARQIEIGRDVAKRYREVLRRLADA